MKISVVDLGEGCQAGGEEGVPLLALSTGVYGGQGAKNLAGSTTRDYMYTTKNSD